ncbi:hypothetical protein [Haloarchaeobius sp. DFWS5]|uniref:hypothetical protein n=1 Tax=Haloarchaeobius sp. DFWS5 TaxID=3446114 RepID=UPI003EBCBD68
MTDPGGDGGEDAIETDPTRDMSLLDVTFVGVGAVPEAVGRRVTCSVIMATGDRGLQSRVERLFGGE